VMDRLARDPLSRQLSRNVASDLLYYTSGHDRPFRQGNIERDEAAKSVEF
jgi:hypothetical protein